MSTFSTTASRWGYHIIVSLILELEESLKTPEPSHSSHRWRHWCLKGQDLPKATEWPETRIQVSWLPVQCSFNYTLCLFFSQEYLVFTLYNNKKSNKVDLILGSYRMKLLNKLLIFSHNTGNMVITVNCRERDTKKEKSPTNATSPRWYHWCTVFHLTLLDTRNRNFFF